MKGLKCFLMLALLSLVFCVSSGMCLAVNVMPTDSWSFTVLADEIPPYVTDRIPAPGSLGNPVDSLVACHVKDDGVGVDILSIVMRVNNNVVIPAITGTPDDYLVQYSNGFFSWNSIVNVEIEASDMVQ